MSEPYQRSAPTACPGPAAGGNWLSAVRRYVAVIAVGNLLWEFAQLPLYTLWHEGSPGEILFAVVHCTGGDLLIASSALLGALLLAGDRHWPRSRFRAVAAIAILGGLAYTVFSEWLNTEIRGSWAYTEAMPQLPLVGAGISPLAQWIVVPLIAFWWASRSSRFQLAKEPTHGQ
ncbi:MAG: hypothetical protein GEU89_11825 [Kiloniellaceae bacterium]|nr:hypothetical protein [Kiloniellaceae bacterium]